MTPAALTQCETLWKVVLASFHERYKKLRVDHPDAKKEMDLAKASTVKIWQLFQKSPKVNGNGAEWKKNKLDDRAEAEGAPSSSFWMDKRYLPAYFTHMQQHTRK
jgi:hypothetical protein